MSVYLDNAATSMIKPEIVAKSMYDFMINNGTTSGRGSYKKAIQSDKLVYEARKEVASFFKFDKPKNVIFTSNITESINLILNGILEKNDNVIISSLEHNAVTRCLNTLEIDREISITKIKSSKEGYCDYKDIESKIKANTKLIVFNHASNVLGTIQPIREIGEIAKKHNILFLVDTAQTAGIIDIDINKDNIDILAFTGHKSLLGPMGIGGLVINTDENIKPLKYGGTGGDSSYQYQPDYYPNKLETGTLNVPAIIGLKEALKFINNKGLENIRNKEERLTKYTLEKLNSLEGVTIYGPKNSKDIVAVISFNIEGKSPEDVAYILDCKYDIMVRAGLHCAPSAHELINTKNIGTVRIGIGYFNTYEDIDKFINAINEIIKNKG